MSIAERQEEQLISKLDRNSMNVQYVLRSVRTFSHRLEIHRELSQRVQCFRYRERVYWRMLTNNSAGGEPRT